jgi:hypothetical protein
VTAKTTLQSMRILILWEPRPVRYCLAVADNRGSWIQRVHPVATKGWLDHLRSMVRICFTEALRVQ